MPERAGAVGTAASLPRLHLLAAEPVVGRSGALLARKAAGANVANDAGVGTWCSRAGRRTRRGRRGRVSRAVAVVERGGDSRVECRGSAPQVDSEHDSAGSLVHPVVALQRRRGGGVWHDAGGTAGGVARRGADGGIVYQHLAGAGEDQ